MKKENGIEELYSYYSEEIRELIDNTISIIFQTYPNVKEKIRNYKEIKYIDSATKTVILIKPNQDNIEVTNKKINKKATITNYEEIRIYFLHILYD